MTPGSGPDLVRGAILGGLLVLLLAGSLFVLRPGQPGPVAGAVTIETARLCTDADCTRTEPITLPWRVPMALSAETPERQVLIDLRQTGQGLQALYLPFSAPGTGASIGGIDLLGLLPRWQRQWNAPVMIPLPDPVRPAGLPLRLTLAFPAQEGMTLWPMQIGPQGALVRAAALRETVAVTSARAILFLSVLLGLANAALAILLSDRGTHLWLAIGNGLSAVFVLQFAAPAAAIGYAPWTVIWTTATCAYAFTLLKFTLRVLDLRYPPLERSYAGFILVMLALGLLAPPQYALVYGVLVNVGSFVFGSSLLAIVWIHRARLGKPTMALFVACYASALALGVYQILMVVWPAPLSPLSLFPLIPLIMTLISGWLVTSQMVRSFAALADQNRTLEAQVRERTKEIEETFASLARARRAEAISEERRRIMLDLHDGIGGHLVSMKAYMDNRGMTDAVLTSAMDDAIRDLGLMLDSLENEENLATLLGMMRTRLEGLLARHGVEFVWKIEGEPVLPDPSPSNTLHVTRIVQEAISNVIKHAGATEITVYADEGAIEISDNGIGIPPAALDDSGPGRTRHGLLGMQRRAKAIGATLDISGTGGGTRVRLDFGPSRTA